MTVGTGIGDSQEKIDSLAHGLLYSIKDTNPDHVVFFGSDKSKNTINSLKKQYHNEFKSDFNESEKYDFVNLINIDNFNECFDKFKEKLLEYKEDIIKIDYTSGTKTMTMTAAISATIYKKDLFLVAGKRGEDSIVKRGTEEKKVQNLYQVYDKFILDKIKDAFNSNRFQTGLELLEETRDLENKESYLKLLKLFDLWDKFNHEEAYNICNDFNNEFEHFPELKNKLYKNKQVINIIVKPKKEKIACYYILADLLNNAIRRANEGKYDDAIARLYRSLELIAQIKLKIGYKLKTSNIDLEKVKKHVKDDSKYINHLTQKSINKSIKLGSKESFTLLEKLNNEIGKEYFKHEDKIKNQSSLRNMSILAHGLQHRSEKEYQEFKGTVFNIAKKLDENIENHMREAEFPRFIDYKV
jgi:CRISPR-associated protein (TIGR02710 family)